jgi:hypothetical protein
VVNKNRRRCLEERRNCTYAHCGRYWLMCLSGKSLQVCKEFGVRDNRSGVGLVNPLNVSQQHYEKFSFGVSPFATKRCRLQGATPHHCVKNRRLSLDAVFVGSP